ncbi:MAG: M23 family metallopeptidase [Micromonosporaceae bacterium]|nr:M23 family metallopeptidase [Micromonosporaceae bacterium]
MLPRMKRWLLRLAVVALALVASAGLAASAPAAGMPGSPAVRAPAYPAAPPAPAPAFRWPLDGTPQVTRPFQPPPQPWLPGHRGVDLAATPGAVVRAAGAGTVAFAGQVAGVGVVSIDHAGGLRTTYEPVRPLVHAGQQVAASDPIAILLAGHPGCPIAACLHWGLRRGDVYLDPLALLGFARIRLLPLQTATG